MAKARKVVGKKKTPVKKTTKKAPAKKGTNKKATESKASSPFLKALKSKAKAYKKFKSAKKGSGFETSNIPDGTYKTRWTAKAGVTRDGDPYVNLNWVVTTGKQKGEKGNRYFGLKDDEAWGWLSSMLQQLLDEDTSSLGDDPTELKDWLDQVNDIKPVTETNISRNGQYLNAYVQALLEDDDEEGEEDEDSEDEEYEDEEEGEEEEESDEEEEGEEEEYEEGEDEEYEEEEEGDEGEEEEEEYEVEISKGDEVSYKKGRKTHNCTVMRVNKTKRTALLESEDGTEFKDVSWDDVKTE